MRFEIYDHKKISIRPENGNLWCNSVSPVEGDRPSMTFDVAFGGQKVLFDRNFILGTGFLGVLLARQHFSRDEVPP